MNIRETIDPTRIAECVEAQKKKIGACFLVLVLAIPALACDGSVDLGQANEDYLRQRAVVDIAATMDAAQALAEQNLTLTPSPVSDGS